MSKKIVIVALLVVFIALLVVAIWDYRDGAADPVQSPDNGLKPPQCDTPSPSPSDEPEELSFGPAPDGYFDDALFIGDSRTVGIQLYGTIPEATYFCSVGMSAYGVPYEKVEIDGLGTVTLRTLLQSRSFGKVYIMLGINDDLTKSASIVSSYTALLDLIKENCPDAIIYVEAVIHVGAHTSAASTVNNENINALNELLYEFCDGESIFYLDVNPVFDDEEGKLNDEYSGDGIHFRIDYYKQWAEWIRNNAIVK